MKLTLNILICLLLFNSSVTFSAPLEKVSLQLKWLHAFQFAGYYAAKEQGFYAEEGLDVDIKVRSKYTDNIAQVVNGESNYGVADSSLLLNRLKGQPVVVLASIFQHNPYVYASLKSSGIVSPYEFKGKRVMEESDLASSVDAPLQAMLYETGISKQDYTHINSSYDYDALINGETDVFPVYLTDAAYYYGQKHVDINIIDPRNYGIDFLGDNLFITEQEISQHPDRTQRFLRASLKGWDYALKHPEEIVQLILRNYNADQRLSVGFLRAEAAETAKMILSDSIPLGSSSVERFQRMAETYQQLGLVKSLDNLNGFIYQPALNSKLNLSPEEKNWLQSHPDIRLAIDKDFPPYESIDDKGRFVGLSADYVALVEQRLGVKFKIITDKPWAEMLDMAKRGKIDLLSDIVQTPEREKYLLFTEPYIDIPAVIISNKSDSIDHLDKLRGKRVAVESSYFMYELLINNRPELQVIPVKNTVDALLMVSSEEADAYIGDAASANYTIGTQGMVSLFSSNYTSYKNRHRMATIYANPLLKSSLDKALADISDNEKQTIRNRWLSLQTKRGIDTKILIRYGVAIFGVFVVIMLWNMSLKREIKRRKQIEAALRESETAFRNLFEDSKDPALLIKNGEFVDCNAVTLTQLGYGSKAEFIHCHPSDISPKLQSDGRDSEEKAAEMMHTAEKKGYHRFEWQHLRADGSVFPVEVSLTAMTIKGESIIHACWRDITERKITEERINQLAFYDPLTQLPNRRLLHERLKHGIEISHRAGNSMAVLMLDLDKFKAVNDTLGHAAGDELLQQVAERIKACLREMDTVARLGGDEFVVLLENITQHEQIAHVANTIIHTLKQPFSLSKNHKAHIGTSIGIALYPQHGNDIETLMDNADTALYRAKDNGRSCFAYFADTQS